MTPSDSCRADSMNPQVLTTTTSAPAASGTRAYPSWVSLPSMRSLSTVFLGQPSETNAYVPLAAVVMQEPNEDGGTERPFYGRAGKSSNDRPTIGGGVRS